MALRRALPMTGLPFSSLAIPGPVSDYLAEGASATEYQKTVRRAYKTFHQSEAHKFQGRGLRLANRSGVSSRQGPGTPRQIHGLERELRVGFRQ